MTGQQTERRRKRRGVRVLTGTGKHTETQSQDQMWKYLDPEMQQYHKILRLQSKMDLKDT